MIKMGLKLGTQLEKNEIYIAIAEVGFNIGEKPVLSHESIRKLRVQVHSPAFLRGVEKVVTELEFDDCSERFPDYPEAMQALRNLYKKIPDLVYLTNMGDIMRYGAGKIKSKVEELSKFFEAAIEYQRRIG